MYTVAIVTLALVGCCFGAALEGKTFSHDRIDYSEAKWGAKTCLAMGRCGKTSLVDKHVPIPHNCVAFCRNDHKSTCASSYFNPTDRHCYMLTERCTTAELVDKNKEYLYYHRLVEGESCPSGMIKYDTPAKVYSDTYCPKAGKRCPGPEMYGSKPWKNQNRKFCADKCNKILTCPMFDWKPNEGVDATDPETLGTCYHKVAKCSDEQLTDDKNSYNYARLSKGETECSSGPPPTSTLKDFCLRKDFNCLAKDNGIRMHLPNIADADLCKAACLDDPMCGTAAYVAAIQVCVLAVKEPCIPGSGVVQNGLDTYFKKDHNGQDCEKLDIYDQEKK